MKDQCKHKYQGDNLYCRLCRSLSEQRARIFIAEVLKARKITAVMEFGADGQVTVTVTQRPELAKITDFRFHLETKIRRTQLVIVEETS